MLGIQFIKAQPTIYLLQYGRGKIVREGTGLSFFYYAPTTSLAAVPISSAEAPFIFAETTADFQSVTIQGQVSYRVSEPRRLATLMNFTLDAHGRNYLSEDPQKLPQRVVNAVNVLARAELQRLTLRQAIRGTETIVKGIRKGLVEANEMSSLGVEILGLAILAVKPTPETARALETETREELLKEADGAIYARRNAAVEQERSIKENELNTDIAVENKKRQIRETQMEAERAIQEKESQLHQAQMLSSIELENKRKELVGLAAENSNAEAKARAYGIETTMHALSSVDTKVVQALASVGMRPEQLIAVAFQELAGRADKIGQLNISPDLLRELMQHKTGK